MKEAVLHDFGSPGTPDHCDVIDSLRHFSSRGE